MAINNLYDDGIKAGWRIHDATALSNGQRIETDIAIIGSGAGGATAAEILSAAGHRVLIIEEGPLRHSDSFRDMNEGRAYNDLYQDAGGRASADGSIAILQGRSVGGTTTVNWTSSFDTPAPTLNTWRDEYAVKGWDPLESKPWFDERKAFLGIEPWAKAPNANNDVLRAGAAKLGWEWHIIPRNVRGCWDSGYCGYGCPVNAKQSMLVTSIPKALSQGAELIHQLRIEQLQYSGDKITALHGRAVGSDLHRCDGNKIEIRAKQVVLSAGGLNSPALLLASNTPDPHKRLGRRTTIHPAQMVIAEMPEDIHGYYGAPQSIASDEFLWPNDNYPGFKMEAAPSYPALAATTFGRHGMTLAEELKHLPRVSAVGGLMRDGFHSESEGGYISVDDRGKPLLHYPFNDYLYRGFQQIMLRSAEATFAAGARKALLPHLDARWANTMDDIRQQIDSLAMNSQRMAILTAHLMGGCAMGEDPRQAVVNSEGQHHQLSNLCIIDGSVFPTSIGANPQLSIYALSAKNASALAKRVN